MIFYSVYFWILFIVAVMLKWSSLERDLVDRALLFIGFVILFIVGPSNVLFLAALLASFWVLRKILIPWYAFIICLIGGIIVKDALAVDHSIQVSFVMLSSLGLFYRSGKIEKNNLAVASLFPLLQVGPIVKAEDVKHIRYEKKAALFSVLTILSGFVCLSLGSSQMKVAMESPSTFLDFLHHLFGVFNFMFLNFQGAVLIASGCCELLGFTVPVNFNQPYLARNMKEFWSRWHISMGKFFSEQVFQPLQLQLALKEDTLSPKKIRFIKIFSLFVTWILIALWHKSTWLFIIWGLYNATLVAIPFEKTRLNRQPIALIFIYFSHIIFLQSSIEQLKNFLVSLSTITFTLPVHLLEKLTGTILSIALFYFSQKIFSWKYAIRDYFNNNEAQAYATVVFLFIVSLVLFFKGQIIIYGQF